MVPSQSFVCNDWNNVCSGMPPMSLSQQRRTGASSSRCSKLHQSETFCPTPRLLSGKLIGSSAGNWAFVRPMQPDRRFSRTVKITALAMDSDTLPGQETLYDLLGISASATVTSAEIKEAYRQMARKYHPDVRPRNVSVEDSTRRFIEVQEAYEVLSDPQRRAMYDFELRCPSRRRRGGAGGLNEKFWTRRTRRQPWEENVTWQTEDQKESAMAGWRQQCSEQLRGLKGRRAAKPGSWAAQMQERQRRQEQGEPQEEL
eukprot:TRINITY_DN15491_c0_g2_i3.p1 TRINITY_DN15491_c0_g2~~TRINITY_DN15491_c0_g2_i3.p1  ORF type:complete len:258 (-),score=32.27 TRINITY_DN15491_c0_g2_i3:14-787(-)